MYCTSLETESGCYDDSNIRDDSKNMDTVNVDTIDVSKFYANNKDKLKFALHSGYFRHSWCQEYC